MLGVGFSELRALPSDRPSNQKTFILSTMHAITLWQPWATLLALGIKQVETRSWSVGTRLRLPAKILIHAAARPIVPAELDMIYSNLPAEICLSLALIKEYPLGSIIGMVTIDSCLLMTEDVIASVSPIEKAFGLWQPGRWAWNCSNPITFNKPIPHKGHQLFWKPDAEALAIAKNQLTAFSAIT